MSRVLSREEIDALVAAAPGAGSERPEPPVVAYNFRRLHVLQA